MKHGQKSAENLELYSETIVFAISLLEKFLHCGLTGVRKSLFVSHSTFCDNLVQAVHRTAHLKQNKNA